MSGELTFASPPLPVANDPLYLILQAATNPALDVEKVERYFAMYERMQAENQRIAFQASMARLQEKLPMIERRGKGLNTKFAKLEDIYIAIKPLLSEEGFSFSFDEEQHTETTTTFMARLSHREGHFEVKRLTVPVDVASKNSKGAPIRPAIQDMGSTASYAQRYLIKMHLNIVERNEDTNGERPLRITPQQVKDLTAMLADVKADIPAFLLYMRVSAIEEILEPDYKTALTAIERKKGGQ